MTTALIGCSGFVGSTLLRQAPFDALFHSKNIDEIRGREFDFVACAGAPAEKWKANLAPDADLANLERLLAAVETARIERILLISTVDVYPSPVGVDEATVVGDAEGHSYGRHRLALERRLAARFPTTVLRLPGLFGTGLRKNVVYDFLHRNQLERISPDGVYQFYPLSRLWSDATTSLAHDLPLVNLVTEPVSVREVAHVAFGFEFENPAVSAATRYDVWSRHAALFGGSDRYLLDRSEVLAQLRVFAEAEGWKRP